MYIVYKNFNIKKEQNHIALSAKAFKILETAEDDNLSYVMKCPAIFHKIISLKLNLIKYDKFSIYTLLKKEYNQITDYKKIWKLCGLNNIGLYDNNYLISEGKVYFGIAEEKKNENIVSKISIYCKDRSKIDFDAIFDIFKINSFVESSSLDTYNYICNKIQNTISNSIVMYYDYSSETLHLFGNHIDEIFCEKDLPAGEIIER